MTGYDEADALHQVEELFPGGLSTHKVRRRVEVDVTNLHAEVARRTSPVDFGVPVARGIFDLGSMATIARFRVVVYTGRLRFAGLLGWLAWLFVHLVFLTGFKNRIAALANWTTAFLGRGRRQRTITLQQLVARTQQPPFQQPLPIETNQTAASTNGTGTRSQPTTQT